MAPDGGFNTLFLLPLLSKFGEDGPILTWACVFQMCGEINNGYCPKELTAKVPDKEANSLLSPPQIKHHCPLNRHFLWVFRLLLLVLGSVNQRCLRQNRGRRILTVLSNRTWVFQHIFGDEKIRQVSKIPWGGAIWTYPYIGVSLHPWIGAFFKLTQIVTRWPRTNHK